MRQSMLSKRGRLGPALVAITLVLGAAACGGDDSGSGGGETVYG